MNKISRLLGATALIAAVAGSGAPAWAKSAAVAWPGEVAYVHGADVYTASAAGAHSVQVGAGAPSDPRWSPDGKWLAFVTGMVSAPYNSLWVVSAGGGAAHRVSGGKGDVLGFSWRPRTGHEIAYYTEGPQGSAGQVVLATAASHSRPPIVLMRATGISGLLWAPDGSELAVGESSYSRKGFAGAKLLLVPVRKGFVRTVATSSAASFLPATWWPDGKGLLFWSDPYSSASIAADGLELKSMELSTRNTKNLVVALVHPEWLSWSRSGNVAVVAGEDRSEWAARRRVEVCDPVSGHCMPQGASRAVTRVTLGPVWEGQVLVYTMAPGTPAEGGMAAPPGAPVKGSQGSFAGPVVRWWYGAQELWTKAPGRSVPSPLTAAGRGAHDAVAAGGGLLFVRGLQVFYLARGARTALRVAGPIGPEAPYANSYYGYVDWSGQFAWHA